VLFLLAVLYPVFTMARTNARAAYCHENLKQLGTALSQYCADNDEMMPDISDKAGGHTWREVIFRYVRDKELYHCPERNDNVDANGFSQNYAANYSGNYGATQPDKGKGAFAGPGSVPISPTEYSNPKKLILLVEAENNRSEFNIDDPMNFRPQSHKLWAGHFSVHSSFLFADGHVKSLRPSDTYLYDPKNKTLYNYWYRNTETRLSANGVAVLKDTQKRFHW